MQHVSLWGESWDSMLGVILFNFALVMAIPAWLSEKKPNVSVSKVVYGFTILSTVLYILVGLFGAMAIPNINANALAPMVSGAFGPGLRVGASIFAFFIVGLDIPLFPVLTRYYLTNSGLCSPRMANLLVVYLPWATAWMFYQGSAIDELLSWGGILFTSAVAFLLPLYLAIRVLQSDQGETTSSIQVYGNWISSKRMELYATVALFLIAFVAVLAAIIGQAYYDEEQDKLLQNATYVNSNIGEVDAAADPDL
jgi:amino acid permease